MLSLANLQKVDKKLFIYHIYNVIYKVMYTIVRLLVKIFSIFSCLIISWGMPTSSSNFGRQLQNPSDAMNIGQLTFQFVKSSLLTVDISGISFSETIRAL